MIRLLLSVLAAGFIGMGIHAAVNAIRGLVEQKRDKSLQGHVRLVMFLFYAAALSPALYVGCPRLGQSPMVAAPLYLVGAGFAGMGAETFKNALWTYVLTGKRPMRGKASLIMLPLYAAGLTLFSCLWWKLFHASWFVTVAVASLLTLWMIEISIGVPCVRRGIRIWDYRGRRGALLDGVICTHPVFWIAWPAIGFALLYLHPLLCVWHWHG